MDNRDVGVVYKRSVGESSARAHSGTALGLAGGLAQCGYRVRLVDAAVPAWADGPVRLIDALARRTGRVPLDSAVAGRLANLRARRLAPSVPLITMSAQVGALPARELITFEDMTVVQAKAFDYFAAPDREMDRRERLQRELYQAARACCVGSTWAATSVVQDYGVDPQRVHIVGRGHSFPIRPVARAWSEPRFLFSGRDWARKNGALVLEAFSEVRAAYPSAELHLVGTHPDVRASGVVSHGYLDLGRPADRKTMARLYAAATCFVMPSICEAFGLSYVEAASFGLPSIGTTVGGAGDAIGEGGLVVDPWRLEQLTAAMYRLADGETARQLGQLALQQASHFTWPVVASRIMAAIETATPEV